MKALVWDRIVGIIKEDASEKDYVVDFLDQVNSIDHTCYVYFKDDDQSAIYALNDQHRAQMEDTLLQYRGERVEEMSDAFWAEMNQHYRMT